MSQADFWYIRFPDGRVLRAASTSVLRHELNAGHIPLASTVRRSPHDEWVSLEWTEEFAELVEELANRQRQLPGNSTPPPAEEKAKAKERTLEPRPANAATDHSTLVRSRLDSARLHLVGVRGYFDELLAALDSTLSAKKLLLGVFAGFLLGALFALEDAAWFETESRRRLAAWPLFAVGLIVFAGLTALLTRLTYIELARLRPARWREGVEGLGRLTVWLTAALVLVGGAAWGLTVVLRWLPFWWGGGAEETWSDSQQLLGGTALILGMLLQALLALLFVLWWLLPALLVVEDCTVWRGLRQWLHLLRDNFWRCFLYQMMSLGLSVLIAASFLLPLAPLFLPSFVAPAELSAIVRGTRRLLFGLTCAPMLTYWITSNVFIYLNLRYGGSGRR
jgi:hypothetical protein